MPSTKRSKIALLTGGILVAIVVLGYFTFFYPPQSAQDTSGTIGGVKKYHSSQIEDKDVQLGQGSSTTSNNGANAGSEVNSASQSAAGQTSAAQTAGARSATRRRPASPRALSMVPPVGYGWVRLTR